MSTLTRRSDRSRVAGPRLDKARVLRSRFSKALREFRRDDGMNTAEYAVGTIAAVAFAALLLRVLTSESVQNALTAIIQRALQ